MKNIIIIPILLLAANLLSSCEDETENVLPVNFELRLLDENGNPSTEFDEGENFVLSFLIINKSNESLYFQSINDMEEFFKIYSTVKNQEPGKPISFGKPYKAIHCQYIGGYPVSSMDTLKIEMPWIPNSANADRYHPILCNFNYDNSPLPVGQYQTSFTSSFTFSTGDQSFTTEEQSFNIDFNIEI